MRKIIHCDCDSFYASIEMRDNPDLRDKPSRWEELQINAVVATCNYAARAYGVRSAMPMSTALRHCLTNHCQYNMAKYKEESARVQEIFSRIYRSRGTLIVRRGPFLDVSDCQVAQGSATLIAEQIRHRVREEIGITISAGIANNKFLAKIASDWKKPGTAKNYSPDQVATFINDLPVEKIFGVVR
ncbi:MAG: hypothetical protein CM15mP68_1240 [Pseudomonadota bacterium]|nr:MAG: hypothetical protein CM15mP68_1240 [Pseudomonadota bacterium]